ncbi:hypothetical protein AAGH91_29135, partial [Escherichia coli]
MHRGRPVRYERPGCAPPVWADGHHRKKHPGQGCAEFFNMLFMGMLAGLYPAERDNLHIIRV